MLIIILATVLIIAMTAFLLSQGLFSSMIMAVLAMLCAAFALNAYPALASGYLYNRQGPIADGVAMIALFVVPLIIARFLADFLVPKNVEFSIWVDRIGGGVFGLLASMTMVGMVLVIMQSLPFGDTVLGYQPYDNAMQRSDRVWPFCPDDFAVSLGSVGAFGGQGSFNDLHADFLREAAGFRNTPGMNGTTFATPKSLRIRSAHLPQQKEMPFYKDIPRDPLMIEGSESQVLVVGTDIAPDAGDKNDDGDKIRLAGTHFRLVTRKTEGKPETKGGKVKLTGDPIDHYPVGYFLPDNRTPKWAPIDDGVAQIGKLLATLPGGKTQTVYWVYRIAQDEMPDYMVFRRVSSQKVSRPKAEMPKLPEPKSKAVTPPKKTATATKPATKKPAK